MYKGIYIALSGAVLKQMHVDVVSQNLSNSSTLAYKKDNISFKDYLLAQSQGIQGLPDGRAMSDVSELATDFSQGNLLKTNNPLDIALEGNGFLSLEGKRYTRRGDLKIDADGYLVNYSGIKILGKSGPIQIPSNGTIKFTDSGDILVNGNNVGRLEIVNFRDMKAIKKAGEDFFVTDQDAVESNAVVKQGFLETSNINIMKEMVQVIKSLREFEMFQKAIHFFDDATSKITNDMGRI